MATEKKLTVLIVDDERAARERLVDMLRAEPDVQIVGQASNGREGVQAIRELAPDLVFLDIHMPGLSGLDVVQEVGPEHMPTVIFVTAYDQYAVKAFDLAALDYLLKPFDDERFAQTIERVRRTIALQEVRDLSGRLNALLRGAVLAEERDAAPPPYLERIAVEMRGQLRIVAVSRIDYISADGVYAELHVGPDTYVIREQMQALEERLNPEHFFRIHRSTIVRLDRIEALLYNAGGDYAVRLKDGTRLKLSRGRRDELGQRLGLDTLGTS